MRKPKVSNTEIALAILKGDLDRLLDEYQKQKEVEERDHQS